MSLKTIESVRFYDYSVDRLRWSVQWQEEPIPLSRKTFDLLLYLIDHRDRVVSKDELLEKLWPQQFIEESNLTQHVFLLRKALSRHEAGEKIIETVPGRGYRFTAPVAAADEPTEEMSLTAAESITRITIEQEDDDDSVVSTFPEVRPSPTRVPHRRKRLALIGVMVLIALALGGWFGWQRWLDHTAGQPIDVILTPLDGSTGDTILDGALVDALRMDLSQSPFVSVVSPARVRTTLAEMKQKPDDAMTPAISREVCERTNSQAVLHGTIARVGPHFLLTEQAISCVDGNVLAESKQEAASTEDLPRNIDRLAEGLRQKLGESRRSIARFDTPLFHGNTASLEALKDYSQATVQSNQGKFTDAISLIKRAIAADPAFAEGYYDLAAYYRSTTNYGGEREAIVKAYNLRDSASEPVRLSIIALYHSAVTQDLYEAERNYRNWTELYPRSAQAWNGLSVVERDLGQHSSALAAATQALHLRPNVMGVYVNLAFEQSMTGDPQGSLATCVKAIARGLDGDYIRSYLFSAAYALHRADLIQEQRDWEAAHPDAIYIRLVEAEIAISEGRFFDGRRLIAQVEATMRHQGLGPSADEIVRAEALNLIETGDVVEGTRLFRSLPVDPEDEISVLGLARVGDFTAAETDLHAMQAKYPQGTLWNDYRAPEIEAAIAMAAHKPKDAVVALERIRPLEGRDVAIPMLRGDAYLAAGEPDLAERSYRQVVEGPNQLPDIEEIPLSWLGLGRALAARGDRTAAVDAYQHFLARWAHADADAMYLKQAQQELTKLQQP